jgi:hypothetical protein
MILGNCIYCDEPFSFSVDPVGMRRHKCEACKKIMWTRTSRIDSWSMKEEDFLKEYEVNEETKEITKKEE